MKIRRAWIALLAVMCASVGAAADPAMEVVDDTPFHAPPDVADFVLAIAASTGQAPGNRSGDRIVTLGRNQTGELVVTSMALVADGQNPAFPAGTVAMLIVRHPGECQPPHGAADAHPLMNRIYTFVADHLGETVWELGYVRGVATFWETKGANDHGPEETFNVDPAKYRIYPCAKYE